MKVSPLRVGTAHLLHAPDDEVHGETGSDDRFVGRKDKKVDLVDPDVHPADKKLNPIKVRFSGPLVRNGIAAKDVVQGALGDCFCPAAGAALAEVQNNKLSAMMKDNEDGSYSFTFKKWDRGAQKFRARTIKVDGDLWARDKDDPLYADGNLPTSQRRMELWFPLFEKAYAIFCGKDPTKPPTYATIGEGGCAEDVFEAVLGRKGYSRTIHAYNEAWLGRELRACLDTQRPVALGTFSPGEKRYTGTGLHADHSYSVLGYRVDADTGEMLVTLRNPWGESEPEGDGKDDGVFERPLSFVFRYFSSFGSVT